MVFSEHHSNVRRVHGLVIMICAGAVAASTQDYRRATMIWTPFDEGVALWVGLAHALNVAGWGVSRLPWNSWELLVPEGLSHTIATVVLDIAIVIVAARLMGAVFRR